MGTVLVFLSGSEIDKFPFWSLFPIFSGLNKGTISGLASSVILFYLLATRGGEETFPYRMRGIKGGDNYFSLMCEECCFLSLGETP
jgi:hypothetical protein